MSRHKYVFILAVLLAPCCLFAQQVKPDIDYSRADSLAMTVKYTGDVNLLTKQLTSPFTDQALKARAIFRWITDNITYDYKYYNKHADDGPVPITFHCPSDDTLDCVIKQKVWEIAYVTKVLDKGKGVCEGYAMLFKKMCDIAGIEAEVVPGYTRTDYYEIGTMGELDHAWNVVFLNGAYRPLDATWAAGGCATDDDGKLLNFHKQYNNYYWLTPPEGFALNHFPETGTLGLPSHYTKDNFSANAYYDPGEVGNLKLIAPASGIITAKHGDTIHFKLQYKGDNLHWLQINTNTFQNPDIWDDEYISKRKTLRVLDSLALKKQQFVKYKQDGDTYTFAYVVKDYTLEWVDILFDTKRVMRFKVNMKR